MFPAAVQSLSANVIQNLSAADIKAELVGLAGFYLSLNLKKLAGQALEWIIARLEQEAAGSAYKPLRSLAS